MLDRGLAWLIRPSVLITWLVFSAGSLVLADQLQGQVVKVSDGDTVTVLDDQRQQHVIRLAGIDAPENSQPHGQKSKAFLSQAVFGRHVTVQFDKRDRYGRIVGKLVVQGEDANLQQLQAGWAWHYKQYQREQTPQERADYGEAEVKARDKHLGLWQGHAPPEPPWAYRARLKSERETARDHTSQQAVSLN